MSGLRRARGEHQRGVAGVQVGQVADVVGDHRAAAAAVIGPAVHVGLDEGAVDDQLTSALEQAQQVDLAVGPVELVVLVDGQPRHPPSLRRERVVRAHHLLLLHQQLLVRGRPTPAPTRSGVCSW